MEGKLKPELSPEHGMKRKIWLLKEKRVLFPISTFSSKCVHRSRGYMNQIYIYIYIYIIPAIIPEFQNPQSPSVSPQTIRNTLMKQRKQLNNASSGRCLRVNRSVWRYKTIEQLVSEERHHTL